MGRIRPKQNPRSVVDFAQGSSLPGADRAAYDQAILQHILDFEQPERWGDEHPVVKPGQWLDGRSVELQDGGMITPEGFLGPLGPVESAGLESFQVEIESLFHRSSGEPSV